MSKYTEWLLKIMILLMIFISLMRIRYIWKTTKKGQEEPSFMFRNREGDWSILLFIVLLLNKSRFDHYKLSFVPILRYFYLIIVLLFIIYSILQLSQLMVYNEKELIAQEAIINHSDIKEVIMKRHLHGYKFIVEYMDGAKKRKYAFVASKKNKEVIEKRFKKQNVNIV